MLQLENKQLQVRRRLDCCLLPLSFFLFAAVLFSTGSVSVLNSTRPNLKTCDKTRMILSSKFGKISDDIPPYTTFNYSQNTHCEWLIEPNRTEEGFSESQPLFISLTFTQLSTECAYDYVFVYDGKHPGNSSFLIASLSGKSKTQKLLARTGSMTIVLFSDTNYVLEGFQADFSVTECPFNCSSRGQCEDGVCKCDLAWTGEDCSILACAENCGQTSNRGSCQISKLGSPLRCQCNPGYSGDDCSLDDKNFIGNTWHYLARQGNSPLGPRTSHGSVFDEVQDALFIYGGFDLNKVRGDFLKYEFKTSQWSIFNFELAEFVNVQGDFSTIPRELKERNFDSNGPMGLAGHAMENIPDGFVIFGGISEDGLPKNDLWRFSYNTSKFEIMAVDSLAKPEALSDHSLTLAGNYLYLFGGSQSNGKISNKMYRIDANKLSEWEVVTSLSPRALDVRVTGHSMVYNAQLKVLVLYGGIHADVARFSRLSDQMLIFSIETKTWAELDLPKRSRPHTAASHIPPERAYHTAKVLGSYMVVFGGYSHQHNDVEACYDDRVYFFHLSCLTWVSERFLEHSPQGRRYPKQAGLFGHSASVRRGNTIIFSGGYSGVASSEVFAFSFPHSLAQTSNDKVCSHYGSQSSCSANPECGWCPSDGVCYLRTLTGKCASNLQTTSCPGICPGLTNCLSCLSIESTNSSGSLVVDAFELHQCFWCSHLGKCLPKISSHICTKQEISWWTEPAVIHQRGCYIDDFTPGLTLLKYYSPPNFSQPDEVSFVNVSEVEFRPVNKHGQQEESKSGHFTVRMLGTIRVPNDVGRRNLPTEKVSACVDNGSMMLKASHQENGLLETLKDFSDKLECPVILFWPNNEGPFHLYPGNSFRIDFLAVRNGSSDHPNLHLKQSKMILRSYRGDSYLMNTAPLQTGYLEAYKNGSFCESNFNCMACSADLKCGWCESTNTCHSRSTLNNSCTQHLILSSSLCTNCSAHIDCNDCVSDGSLCEWILDDARCVRRGRFNESARVESSCPSSCENRLSCSACLGESGRCVWCEETQECFLFSVYTSKFKYGRCKYWIDKDPSTQSREVLLDDDSQSKADGLCSDCNAFDKCSSCLQKLGCGWCFDSTNPLIGKCQKGGFGGPAGLCTSPNSTSSWEYDACPDVDECSLGLHDCHENATCSNKPGAFECNCNKGFIGDGRSACDETCQEECVHGKCSQGPDFRCVCDIGWTGADCTVNCGCNFHAHCPNGVGICDACQDNTTGEYCQTCQTGNFGNASDPEIGCSPCQCNQHGDPSSGLCDPGSGRCFCLNFTEGDHCDVCTKGFYGDPRSGGHCYHDCSGRSVINYQKTGFFGSFSLRAQEANDGQQHKVYPFKKCLWIISANNFSLQSGSDYLSDNKSTILFRLEKSNHLSCFGNYVLVYDGLPKIASEPWTSKSKLLAAYCNDQHQIEVEATSGLMSIVYEDDGSLGFNASFVIQDCPSGCDIDNRHCDKEGKCVCNEGYRGLRCSRLSCPSDCGSAEGRGQCNIKTGICRCNDGFSGDDCSESWSDCRSVTSYLNVDYLDTPHSPLPRFGGSLLADGRGNLWVFGGYSQSTGSPLNDVRAYDTKSGSWLPVTIQREDSKLPELPPGRYFHASAFLHDHLYVYGGLAEGSRYLKDFWRFNIITRTWEKIHNQLGKKLAGLTMTVNEDEKTLVFFGGLSDEIGFSREIYEYVPPRDQWQFLRFSGYNSPMTGIYGHSCVYSSNDKSFFIFGGILFDPLDGIKQSGKLYSYHYPSGKFSLIFVQELGLKFVGKHPQMRFFHSAVTTRNMMIVFGGASDLRYQSGRRASKRTPLSPTAVYVYSCNLWLDLSQDTQAFRIGGSSLLNSIGSSATISGNDIYIMAGYFANVEPLLKKVQIVQDYCHFLNSECPTLPGCSGASVSLSSNLTDTLCFTPKSGNVTLPCNFVSSEADVHFSYETNCIGTEKRNCSAHKTCTECLADYDVPVSIKGKKDPGLCKWCSGCKQNQCVPISEGCISDQNCQPIDLDKLDIGSCPSSQCNEPDCDSCTKKEECFWDLGEEKVGNSGNQPGRCSPKSLSIERYNNVQNFSNPVCPLKCHHYDNCKDCLRSASGDSGWKGCFWSESFGCTSPNELPLRCVSGLCGRIVSGNPDSCPVHCSSKLKCSSCLGDPQCGWCGVEPNDLNGAGICTIGTLHGPKIGHCDLANFSSVVWPVNDNEPGDFQSKNPPRSHILQTSWNYLKCPVENECSNGHHTCDPLSEICIDTLEGFDCECNVGYRRKSPGSKICEPICDVCVHGDCVRPGVCKCHFSYVGTSCDTPCQCNKHSECAGTTQLDVCLDCKNNTMGDQCQFCKPLFVGDPRDGKACKPCFEYCNSHSKYCFDGDEIDTESLSKLEASSNGEKRLVFPQKVLDELLSKVIRGPTNEAICVNCAEMTLGPRCERCSAGHYRSTKKKDSPCFQCKCNGHGNMCNEDDGGNCQCTGNTVSEPTSCEKRRKDSRACHEQQCARCKEHYMGMPQNSHQCYRQMTVDVEYCFDPTSHGDCYRSPKPLPPGETVFFVVLPKFMNVDIRIVLDVSFGEVDVIVTPDPQILVVDTNYTQQSQELLIDPNFLLRFYKSSLREADFRLMRLVLEKMTQSNPGFDPQSFDDELEELAQAAADLMSTQATLDEVFLTTMLIRSPKGKQSVPQLASNVPAALFSSSRRFLLRSHKCDDSFGTYITVDQPDTILHVTNLKNRLVITLPESNHDLRTTKFFFAISGTSKSSRYQFSSDWFAKSSSQGALFFRQDQLHIDLFVFFSVFFACFFLFLALLVVAWKIRAEADMRRARRRHAVEMHNMAMRPFSSLSVVFRNCNPDAIFTRYNHTSKRTSYSKSDSQNKLGQQRSLLTGHSIVDSTLAKLLDHDDTALPKPVATEPTADGQAVVATLIIEMPESAVNEKANGQSLISFGCTLITPINQRSLKKRHGGGDAAHAISADV